MLIRLYVHVLMMMIRLFSGFYTVLLLYLDYILDFGIARRRNDMGYGKEKSVLIPVQISR